MSEVKGNANTTCGLPGPTQEKYLGDGVYASFDGHKIRLRAPRDCVVVEIYLGPSELRALVDFARESYRKAGI